MYTTPQGDPKGDDSAPKRHPAGSSYRNVADKRSVSMLGLGMVIGAAIGAGVALLAAPHSGEETRDRIRDRIRDRVRHIRGSDGMWDRLGRELRRAAMVKRKDLERRKREEQKVREHQRAERDSHVPPA